MASEMKLFPATQRWVRSPPHLLGQPGAYIVTSGCCQKQPFFSSATRLTFLVHLLLDLAEKYGWHLQTWAVFPNHYHFVGESAKPHTLRVFIRHLHSVGARYVNEIDHSPGRRIWFQYWDTHLASHRSYVARLGYVHLNAVKHGLVQRPEDYPWCFAGWFRGRHLERLDPRAMEFSHDQGSLKEDLVPDDYDVEPIQLD
jgi:putative transposase